MANIVFLRGTAQENSTYVGVNGLITIDTVTLVMAVHDGVTPGGTPVLKLTEIAALLGEGLVNHIGSGDHDTRYYTQTQLDAFLNAKINVSERNVPFGLPSLDGNGKIVLSQVNDAILGQVSYQGVYDAATNSPALPDPTTAKGDYYVVSVPGNVGGNDYQVGDWIISNGSYWDRVDNTDAVNTVAGRTGHVVLTKADVGLSNLQNIDYSNADNLTSGNLPPGRFSDSAHGVRSGGNLHNPVTTTVDGFMTAADKVKLNTIQTGAQVNVPTNLGGSATDTVINLTSSTGTGATINAATTAIAGLLTAADKQKLDGIQSGAQANSVTSVNGLTGVVILNKGHVGLSNVPNVDTTNANNLTSGSLPTARFSDASHGIRSGGDLHSLVTTLAHGFMAAGDKSKLDGISAGAQVNPSTTASRSDNSIVTVLQAKGMFDHVGSGDHDSRYYTKTEIDNSFGGVNGNLSDKASLTQDQTFSGFNRFNRGISDGLYKRVKMPAGGTYTTTTNNVTGALCVRLPVTMNNSNTMMRFKVEVFNYLTGTSTSFVISGYNHTSGWTNVTADQIGGDSLSALNVRFGEEGGRDVIWIGETNHAWLYPQVFISEFFAGFSGFNGNWAEGWAIDFVTSFGTVEVTKPAAVAITQFSISSYAAAPSHTHDASAITTGTFAQARLAGTYNIDISGHANSASSANIATTANTLTTPRTLTIGGTGKSFNGGANLSWSLGEIGAAASNHNHDASEIVSGTLPAARFNDSTHGARSGGSLHNAVTTTVNGFMIAADKVKLNNTPNFIVSTAAPDNGQGVDGDIWLRYQ